MAATTDYEKPPTLPADHAPISAYAYGRDQGITWHDVPAGYYAIPVGDWGKFTDDCGSTPDSPTPVLDLLGYATFRRVVPSGRRRTDELRVGQPFIAGGVRQYSIRYGGEDLSYSPWERLKREISGDRYVCEHDTRCDGDPAPPCRCITCVSTHGNSDGSWKAVPRQREAYIDAAAAVILTDIREGEDTYRRTYGQLTGQCGHCGRRLTDPDSKLLGIGPDCLAAFRHYLACLAESVR